MNFSIGQREKLRHIIIGEKIKIKTTHFFTKCRRTTQLYRHNVRAREVFCRFVNNNEMRSGNKYYILRYLHNYSCSVNSVNWRTL